MSNQLVQLSCLYVHFWCFCVAHLLGRHFLFLSDTRRAAPSDSEFCGWLFLHPFDYFTLNYIKKTQCWCVFDILWFVYTCNLIILFIVYKKYSSHRKNCGWRWIPQLCTAVGTVGYIRTSTSSFEDFQLLRNLLTHRILGFSWN